MKPVIVFLLFAVALGATTCNITTTGTIQSDGSVSGSPNQGDVYQIQGTNTGYAYVDDDAVANGTLVVTSPSGGHTVTTGLFLLNQHSNGGTNTFAARIAAGYVAPGSWMAGVWTWQLNFSDELSNTCTATGSYTVASTWNAANGFLRQYPGTTNLVTDGNNQAFWGLGGQWVAPWNSSPSYSVSPNYAGTPASAMVTVSGTAVTWSSGAQFSTQTLSAGVYNQIYICPTGPSSCVYYGGPGVVVNNATSLTLPSSGGTYSTPVPAYLGFVRDFGSGGGRAIDYQSTFTQAAQFMKQWGVNLTRLSDLNNQPEGIGGTFLGTGYNTYNFNMSGNTNWGAPHIDSVLAAMHAAGIHLNMGPITGFSGASSICPSYVCTSAEQSNLQHYIAYVSARWGAFSDFYEIAAEMHPTQTWVDHIGAALATGVSGIAGGNPADPYGHFITVSDWPPYQTGSLQYGPGTSTPDAYMNQISMDNVDSMNGTAIYSYASSGFGSPGTYYCGNQSPLLPSNQSEGPSGPSAAPLPGGSGVLGTYPATQSPAVPNDEVNGARIVDEFFSLCGKSTATAFNFLSDFFPVNSSTPFIAETWLDFTLGKYNIGNFMVGLDPAAVPISVTLGGGCAGAACNTTGLGSTNHMRFGILSSTGNATTGVPNAVTNPTVTLTVPQASMTGAWVLPSTGATLATFTTSATAGSQSFTYTGTFNVDLWLQLDAPTATVTLNGVNYNLQQHPRVMLDGPSGALSTALQNTATRANVSNIAYAALQTQTNNYVSQGYQNPMTDYALWSDTGSSSYNAYPGNNTLMCALMWWAQGGPSQSPIDPNGYLACAEYGIENAIRIVGNSAACPTGSNYCGPVSAGERTNDTDYVRQYIIAYAQAYSIIRSQLTTGQRQTFANYMLNDWTASQGGIDTTACTPQSVTQGTGTLSTSGSSQTVTITGGTTSQIGVGYVIFNTTSTVGPGFQSQWSPATVVTGITNSTTFTVSNSVNIPSGLSFPLIYSPPWTTGNCGIVWFMKHHSASPPIAPNYVGNYNSGGGDLAPDLNLNLTGIIGELAIGDALADDDPRAVTLFEQAYNWYYANQYGFYLSADTGFSSSGNAYSNARTHRFKHQVYEMIQKSVISGPNLGGQYLTREIPFEFMGMLPDSVQGSTYDVIPFQQADANKWGTGSGGIETLYTIAGIQSTDPSTPYLNYYLMTRRGDYVASSMGSSTSWSEPTVYAYIFMDPAATQTNITGFSTQYLFNDTEYSTCVSLGLTCYPNQTWSQVLTRSGWSSTDDVAMLEAGWTNGSDHSSGDTSDGMGNWGDFRIYRNSAFLLADDTGAQTDHTNSPEQMNMIELGAGANWAQGTTYENWPTPSYDVYCSNGSGGGGSRSYGGTYGGCNAPILRWASTDPTGDSSNRYMYVMTDMKNVYNPNNITSAPVRVQRHIMHFKKPSYQDYFVVYDDVATGAATTIAALWQYGLCAWVPGQGSSSLGTCGTPASVINFSGNTVSDTQASSQLNSTFIYPGAAGTLINQGNTYTGHNIPTGLTNRLYSCQGSSGTCNTSATSFEEIVVHQPVNGTGTMPTLTALTCSGTGGNCAAQQIADSGYPRVAMFARQGVLLTGASFTSTHSGTAQYLLAGFAPASYNVTVGGSAVTGSPFTVNSGDNTIYFESTGGAVAVSQVGGVVVPTVTTTTVSGVTSSGGTTGGTVTSNGGASVTSEGVYYGLSSPPGTLCAAGGTSSPFTVTLGSGGCTALSPNTGYYYQACATNSAGQGCGSILSFTTLVSAAGPSVTVSGAVKLSGNTVFH